jgi:hypothetical protein
MKKQLFSILTFFIVIASSTGQELIINGDFSNSWGSWPATPNSQLTSQFVGGTSCPQFSGNPHVYFGDIDEATGVNDMVEGMYQQVTLPANASSIALSFKLSINTLEDNAVPYDFLKVNLLTSSGALITTLWNIDNSYGYYGIPGCSPWFTISSSIPSTYFGQTVRLAFECTTDGVLPTIFRVDDISLFATTNGGGGCLYSLSQNSYVCPNFSSNNYSNVVLVNTQAGCSWTAVVLSGSNWLATGSTGNGTGAVSIIVSANPGASPRTGIVSVGNQTFTVTQPGASCSYSLSSSNYVCPSSDANTYSSVALINTQANCSWSATVTSGNTWLACSSSASGSGSIDIIVQANPTASARTGTISIEGQVLNITQPANSVGVREFIAQPTISVYPVPAKEFVKIELSNTEENLTIHDIVGKVVYSNNNLKGLISLDVSNWPRGVYICAAGQVQQKLIIE